MQTEQQKAEAYVRSKCNLTKPSFKAHGETWHDANSYEIHLEHWLMVLENCAPYDNGNWYTNHGDVIFMIGDGMDVERVKVTFNLTTGQPATEADYKSFNEVVGATKTDKTTEV